MKTIINTGNNYIYDNIQPKVVALGNFDGVHIGHMKLVEAVNSYKSENPHLSSCIWTFFEHSLNILKNNPEISYITTINEKMEIFNNNNLDIAFFEDFNKVKNMSPAQFVDEILIDRLKCEAVVCGFNFRFGRHGEGGTELLKLLLARHGKAIIIIPPVEVSGTPVSSSAIRHLIKDGELEKVEIMLGRPFSIKFPVIRGNTIGQKIGVPTINQMFPNRHIVPLPGVYACSCVVDGTTYIAAANVGSKPTVGGTDPASCETHIIGFSGDLYGQSIKVNFHKYLRGQKKFNGLNELKKQIFSDINKIEAFFNTPILTD